MPLHNGRCSVIETAEELSAALQACGVVGCCDPPFDSPDELWSGGSRVVLHRCNYLLVWLEDGSVDLHSAAVCLLAMRCTVESFEFIWEAASPHLFF